MPRGEGRAAAVAVVLFLGACSGLIPGYQPQYPPWPEVLERIMVAGLAGTALVQWARRVTERRQ